MGELIKYHSPSDDDGAHPSTANRLGIRRVSFVVDDLDTGLDGLRSKGLNTFGEVQDYKETFRLCYVRGPEGIIVELAEQIGSNATAVLGRAFSTKDAAVEAAGLSE